MNRNKIAAFGSPIVDTFLIYEDDPELSEKVKKSFKLHMSEIDCVDWNIYNQIFINYPLNLYVSLSYYLKGKDLKILLWI